MGWSRFFRRAKWDRERSEEIESYVQMETDDNIARGMSEREALAAARRKFGNTARIREEIYGMNTITFLDTLVRDGRFGLRMLRRNPLFTTTALLTLAIGIGANTAVFSVLNSVLLKPLAYPKAEELVAVWQKAPGAEGLADISGDLRLSAAMYFTYADQNRTLQALGVWNAGIASVTGIAEPEQVRVAYFSDGLLQAFNVPPLLGRWLSQDDQKPGASDVVMLSQGYWQRRFGGDRSAIGRSILMNSRPRQIVGIMPEDFRLPNSDFDVIVPLALDRSKLMLSGFSYEGVARLKPGVSIAQANADLARLVPVWMQSWPMVTGVDPKVFEKWKITPALRPLKQEVVGNAGNVLWVLMGTIGLVMLIACANVANLLLVRAEARQQELAVRAALGAGWSQLVRTLLIESTLLGLLGGALGLTIAYAGVRLLVAIGPGNLPRLHEISIDGFALWFAIGVSLLSGLLFGLIPALKYAGARIALTLRSSGRTQSHSRDRHRGRSILVVVQVALALVLLICAGLMIRTFQSLRNIQPGFTNPGQLQTMRVFIPGSLVREPERAARMQNAIADRLAAIPGVSSAAFASEMPMEGFGSDWDVLCREGDDIRNAELPPVRHFRYVSPGLFQTIGTRVIAGRDYRWEDFYGLRPYAIVSENLARELWGSASAALGKQLSTCLPGAPWREVIGVVEDVRQNGLHEAAPATVYWPSLREGIYPSKRVDTARFVTFAIRTDRAGTEGLLKQVNEAVWSVNTSLPVASVRTMQEVYDRSLSRISFTLVMLGIAGAMALVLGLIGIYGVISYTVSQRKREIGIRMALGAQPGPLRRMFVRYALVLAALGVAIGLGAAAGLTRLMKSLLYGISPLDPMTYITVPLILVAAAVLASYLPAWRAAKVDPMEALKAD